MAKERNALRAGLFIVISGVLIIAILVAIQGLGRLVEPRQTRVATFKLTDDVAARSISLPMANELAASDRERIAALVTSVL